jgi:hypothetical protein
MPQPVFGIGKRWEYDAKLSAGKPLVKLGKGVDKFGLPYPGGSVWRSVADAEQFIAEMGLRETHSVYAVLADWESDTEQLPGEFGRRLLRHALVAKLPPTETA